MGTSEMGFKPTFRIDPRSGESAYMALARHMLGEIRRGRLPAGTRLPGTRSLARELCVSRNTVLYAYDELLAQGWLETRQASGTYVAACVPQPATSKRREGRVAGMKRDPGFAVPTIPGFPSASSIDVERARALTAGVPDNRLIPVDLLARAYRRVLKRQGNQLLGYGDPRGYADLRDELAKMYAATRGLVLTRDNVLITRGAQMALSLAARLLIRPGDRVAVERYGYGPMWDTLRLAGAQLVPVPVDESGMQVHQLEQLGKLRAVYLTPHHQYPTTVLLSPERRSWLLDWATRERCAVLEDDYDHEFHYRGQPVLPLMNADRAGVVLYIGGLSKVLAPGLRIGCLVGPAALIEKAAVLRRTIDHQGDQPTEAAVAELLKTDEVPRHIRRMKRVYVARRDALLDALDEALPGCFEIRVPAGGMALWARITDGTDPERWASEAAKHGVGISSGRRFDIRNRSAPFLRLGFAANSEEEIARAVQSLAKARLRARRTS